MNREPKHLHEEDEFEEVPRRSIFAEWWFRTVVIIVALLVVVVVGAPYLLDWWAPPPPPTPSVKTQIPPPPPPLATGPAEKAEPPKASPAQPSAKLEPTAPQPVPPPSRLEPKATEKPEVPPAAPTRERRMAAAPAGGEYWIQVGAFKDEANAAGLAARLAAEKYPARHLPLARRAGGSHEVFVIGSSASDVNGKLPSKDYRAEAVGSEVVIRPALPLREAVNLSKELAGQGLTVKIRRSRDAETFHVVRVGAYPDRQRAQVVQKELTNKGLAGFIIKGEAR